MSQNSSTQVECDMMQKAVATCPKVNMGCGRKKIPLLPDLGSQATLICQSYLEGRSCPT